MQKYFYSVSVMYITLSLLISSCSLIPSNSPDITANWKINDKPARWAINPNPAVFGTKEFNVTSFALSQVNVNEHDQKIASIQPEINIRAWQRWRLNGTKLLDYNADNIDHHKKNDILFIGGTTASVVFEEEPLFNQITSTNTFGKAVPHSHLLPGLHRANIANPHYREYLIRVSKMQIDMGVDGLFFDEVSSSYMGNKQKGNEGFDNFHLAAFNQYICERYSSLSSEALNKKFNISNNNSLKCHSLSYSPSQNFNYRRYLEKNNFLSNPFNNKNLLAKIWGRTYDNRPNPTQDNFVEYLIYHHWYKLVLSLREYARDKYDKEILITSNGIYPFVDFQSVGLYPYNHDNNGRNMPYMPTSGSRLDGSLSLKNAFTHLKRRAQKINTHAPIVVFIDWPTTYMNDYYGFSQQERRDFLKLYASQAYASGIYFAMPVKTTLANEPTAHALNIDNFIKSLLDYFKNNKAIYHRATTIYNPVSVNHKRISASMTQTSDGKRVIHLINHNYNKGIITQEDILIKLKMPISNLRKINITSSSHEFSNQVPLKFTHQNGVLSINVPKLISYIAITIHKETF